MGYQFFLPMVLLARWSFAVMKQIPGVFIWDILSLKKPAESLKDIDNLLEISPNTTVIHQGKLCHLIGQDRVII